MRKQNIKSNAEWNTLPDNDWEKIVENLTKKIAEGEQEVNRLKVRISALQDSFVQFEKNSGNFQERVARDINKLIKVIYGKEEK